MKKSRGFTIIELFITLAIVAILVTVAMPSYRKFIEKSYLRGAAEDIYERLQYARSESLKKSVPMIVDFSANNTMTWSLGITDKAAGCDASVALVTDAQACTVEYDNDTSVDYKSDGVSDLVLNRLASTGFKNITMKGSGGNAPSFTGTPGTCITANPEEACFEPLRGLARSTAGHILLISSPTNYKLQLEVDAVGGVKVCVPAGAPDFLGYDDC